MTSLPSLSYREVIRALQRDGWVVVRQRGSHIRLQKHVGDRTLKITVPAHRPVKRSTLSHILKQAELELDHFLELL
ncbi:MAG: type II toxin-antitoxin system HicA family toxin [Dehalococcoidia bacterium]|nr:type II toxin-antitoxin system HicA family toxin [Dehalococcoidia bacterium]